MIQVVAALIIYNQKILLAQRNKGELKGKWEFPGGKIEENETKSETIIREIKEELGIDIDVVKKIKDFTHQYEFAHISLTLMLCKLQSEMKDIKLQGSHEKIAWVGILDRDITISTMKGYYIVFLFTADMKEVSLTLAVGWEQFKNTLGTKEGMITMEKIVRYLQTELRSPLNDFTFARNNLKASLDLGKGYESGIICHKTYSIISLPSDDVIINDIRSLMGVYRELKGFVGTDILDLELPENEITESNILTEEV